MRYVILALLALLLGCQTVTPVITTAQVSKQDPIICYVTQPPNEQIYRALRTTEREQILLGYSRDLLADFKDCKRRIQDQHPVLILEKIK